MKSYRWFLMSFLSGMLGVAFYFSGLFVLFTPLVFFYSGCRSGWKGLITSLTTAGLLVTGLYHWFLPVSLAHPDASWQAWIAWPGFGFLPSADISVLRFFGFGYFIYYGLIALFLNLGLWKKWPLIKWGAWGIFFPSLVLIALSVLTETVFGLPILATLRDYLKEMVVTIAKLQQQVTSSFEGDLLLANQNQLIHFILYSLPGLLFSMTTLVFVSNLWGARVALKVRTLIRTQIDFLRLQIPFAVIWVVIGSGVLYFFNLYLVHLDALQFVAINLFLSVIGFYFFQGFSILIYFVRKRSFWLKFGIYGAMILFIQAVVAILVGLGFADVWFDFRRLNKTIKSD